MIRKAPTKLNFEAQSSTFSSLVQKIAGTGDSAYRSWRYRCSIVPCTRAIFLSWTNCSPPLIIVDDMHTFQIVTHQALSNGAIPKLNFLDTETEFPGIWTYLRRVVDIFSILSLLRRSQDWFSRQKIDRFFWREFSGEELLPENSFLGQ